MITIKDKSACCGCSACASICGHQAITMKSDGMGFLYPEVDQSRCVDCGLCNQVCAFNANYDTSNNLPAPEVYAVRHKDMNEISTSRSGAVFIALSDWILEQGGVVYGVGYEGHFRVVHKRATNKEERNEFKGSKYVQSDLKDTFLQIKQDLKKEYKVMFSGTPCQTSGLLSYLKLLKQDISQLYVVDLVCHGVPAPYVWRGYLKYIEKKYRGEVTSFNFRDKSQLGWSAHKESFRMGDKYICISTYSDLFGKCIMFRHSCSVCHFANLKRPSDLTIGDFWGWEKVDQHINADDKGVSLLLVNTEKGRHLFSKIANQIYYLKTDTRHCLQPNLEHPSLISSLRAGFERDFISRGFVYCIKKYGNIGAKHQLFCFLSKVKHKILG